MMMFQDNMFHSKNGEEPRLIFGKALESKDLNAICDRLNNHPKGKHLNKEPIFEYIVNKGQQLRLYFDDDGDTDKDYNSLSDSEFETLCNTRNESNINKLNKYFDDTTLDISSSSYNGYDMSNVS